MKVRSILSTASAVIMLTGCSTFQEGGTTARAGKGAAVGAAAGAAAGSLIGGFGAIGGALVGAVAGSVAGGSSRKKVDYFRDSDGRCYYLTRGNGRVYDPSKCAEVIEK